MPLRYSFENARENLTNLTDCIDKLNKVVTKALSSFNSILAHNIELGEPTCQGQCQIHCNLLTRAQTFKKLKGRKSKVT